LFIKKGKRPPREDCEEKVRAAVSQCNQELRTCSNEKATLQKEIADLKDKVKPIPEPTKSENDRIIEEISQYSFPSLCPRFDGKTFQTVNRDGTKNEWHLICGANCNGRTWQWAFEWPCHTQNLIQLLREKQDQRDYHGVWLRMDGACNQQVSGGTPYCVPRPGNRHPWVRRTRAFFTD
jgi:cell division septum initiation protein DivIVA